MTDSEIRQALLDCLARRDYSRQELHQRLAQRGVDPVNVNLCLDELQNAGYQSDLRFSTQAISSRAQRGYGPLFIRQWLRHKGVAVDVIIAAFEQVDVNWQLIAQHALRRKFLRGKEAADVVRQKRFLSQRGFDSEQISAALVGSEDLNHTP